MRRQTRGGPSRARWYALATVIIVVAVAVAAFLLYPRAGNPKLVILFVNQGNGLVDQTSFPALLTYANTHGFNTIFFQVYRSGGLLFNSSALQYFVTSSHGDGLKLFFDLYFTNSTQQIPSQIYALGEDGINLDMSTLPLSSQQSLLANLQANYSEGKTAITTTSVTLPLKPDLLILETYGKQNQQFIRHGIIGSVGAFATSGLQDYQQQFQYALDNSDGVMVFDYAGLVKAGY